MYTQIRSNKNNTGEIEEQAYNSRYKKVWYRKRRESARESEGVREGGREGGRGEMGGGREGRCNLALLESPAPSRAVDPLPAV
jgi:hypothetical protein